MSYRRKINIFSMAVILSFAVLISACGYSLRQAPAIRDIRLGNIRNLTFEPALQDTFILALERELTRLGIRVDRSAGHVIEGKITKVNIKGTAEASDVLIQYEIAISGDFWIITPEGKRVELKGRDNFIVSFSGSDTLERLMASKESALETALTNLAVDIASDIAANRGVPYGTKEADEPDEPDESAEQDGPYGPDEAGQGAEKTKRTREGQ